MTKYNRQDRDICSSYRFIIRFCNIFEFNSEPNRVLKCNLLLKLNKYFNFSLLHLTNNNNRKQQQQQK